MYSGAHKLVRPWAKLSKRRAASATWSSSPRCHLTATEASTTSASVGRAIRFFLLLPHLTHKIKSSQRSYGTLLPVRMDSCHEGLASNELLGSGLREYTLAGRHSRARADRFSKRLQVLSPDADGPLPHAIGRKSLRLYPAPNSRRAHLNGLCSFNDGKILLCLHGSGRFKVFA